MGIEVIVLKQYQNKVNQALKQLSGYSMPSTEGWIKTVRKALGMSGSQLAKRLGVTKGRVSQAESAELSGGSTIKSMQNMAQAMDCRFVYAIIPKKEIDSIITGPPEHISTWRGPNFYNWTILSSLLF